MEFNGVTYPDVKLPCNRETMTELVEALESGEYEQATGRLLRIDPGGKKAFCCLGVACDKSGLGHWEGEVYVIPNLFRAATAFMPEPVSERLGLPFHMLQNADALPLSAHVPGVGQLTALHMNDQGATFAEIAAAIRKVYLSDPEETVDARSSDR